MRRTKATKVLATILCQCMVLGMISMNVQATTVTDNPNGNTIDSIGEGDTMQTNNGTVTRNHGTVTYNNGTVTTNHGTVTYNKGTVGSNYGTMETNNSTVTFNKLEGIVTDNEGTVGTNEGAVTNNYGIVTNNNGTVINNCGTVENNSIMGKITNDYREVTISGTNADKIAIEGVYAASATAPDDFRQKRYVLIKSSTVSSGTINLTPMTGYHFVSAPTVSPDCTVTESGTGYSITDITQVISISIDIVADTPDPAPTPATNDSDDSNEDDKKTVPALNPYEIFIQTLITNIKNAKEDSTVVIESEDCNSYSYDFMKEILNKRDVTVKMSYNYKGEHYEVVIPKNEIFLLDDKIPWYGPLKLEQMFGAVKTPLIK